jgi:hypothetical protein
LRSKVPADRLAAFRRAFEQTLKDSAFLADVEYLAFSLSPRR